MKRPAAVLLLALAAVPPAPIAVPPAIAGAMPAPTEAPAGGGEAIVDRAFVPSAKRPQGEVRLLRRGGQVVVQTILYTRVLKRVLANISGKERNNWPAGRAGHAEMERYVAALEDYRKRLTADGDEATGAEDEATTGTTGDASDPAGAGAAGSGRRKTMLIEFVNDGKAPFVAIGGVEIDGAGADVKIRKRGAPVVLRLPGPYIEGNMRLIVADAFGLSPEEADRRIARAAAP